jgi:hypothetical protein
MAAIDIYCAKGKKRGVSYEGNTFDAGFECDCLSFKFGISKLACVSSVT